MDFRSASFRPTEGFLAWKVPYLVVAAVLLFALAALEQVGGGAHGLGQLVLTDGILGQGVPQLLQIVTGHLLAEMKKTAVRALTDNDLI